MATRHPDEWPHPPLRILQQHPASGHLRSPMGQPEARAWGQEAPGLAALKASFNLGLLPPPPTPPAE